MGLFGNSYNVGTDGSLTDDQGNPAPDSVQKQSDELFAQNRAWARQHPDIIAKANGGGRGRSNDGGKHPFKPKYSDPTFCQDCNLSRGAPVHDDPGGQGRLPGGAVTPDDIEDERGPEGDKMPRLDDAPQYTLIGQILKRFSK